MSSVYSAPAACQALSWALGCSPGQDGPPPGRGAGCLQSGADSPAWSSRASRRKRRFSGVRRVSGPPATGGEEAPGAATSPAKAVRSEVRGPAESGSTRIPGREPPQSWERPELLYPEGSRGSKRLMGHRVHRAPGLGGWAGSPLPGLAGLLASGPALPLARPSRRPADRLPSSPAIPLSPPTLVAETISPCPAKGLILTGCDLSNKTLGGRARRSGELGAAGPGGRHVHQSHCFPT